MTHPLIEKFIEEYNQRVGGLSEPEKKFLQDQISLLIKAVVEEVMPPKLNYDTTADNLLSLDYTSGFNSCRQTILDNLNKLI